jgi:hypothetical protein
MSKVLGRIKQLDRKLSLKYKTEGIQIYMRIENKTARRMLPKTSRGHSVLKEVVGNKGFVI